jgi:hypothetical protein
MVYVSNRSLPAVNSMGLANGVTSDTKGIMQRECQTAIRF